MTSKTFILSGLICWTLQSSSVHTPRELTLQEAIAQNLISAIPVSNGGYSEESVQLDVQNLSSSKLIINIPAGTLYHPSNDGEQTLLQVENEMLALQPKSNANLLVDAFCTESSDSSPSSGDKMKIDFTKNEGLLGLIKFSKGKHIASSEIQDAVWTITDARSISHIERNNEDTKSLREYVAQLTGQEDTWYEAPEQITIDEDGRFNFETVVIDGEIKFNCQKGDPIFEDIIGPDGEVMISGGQIHTALGSMVTYQFTIKVKGWPKGDYSVKLHNGSTTYKSFDFVI